MRCARTQICKFLLENGSEKDQKNSLGWTPLHEACYFNHLDTVQLLLVHGADPLTKNVRRGGGGKPAGGTIEAAPEGIEL